MNGVYTKPFSYRRREMLNTLNRIELIRLCGDVLTDREKAGLYNLDETFRKVVRGKIRETLTKNNHKEKFLLRLNKNDFSVKVLDENISNSYRIISESAKILDNGQTAPILSESIQKRFVDFIELFEDDMKEKLGTCIPSVDTILSYVKMARGYRKYSRIETKDDGRLFFYYSLVAGININESICNFENEAQIISEFKENNHVNGLREFIDGVEQLSLWSDNVKVEDMNLLKLINILDVPVLSADLNKIGKKIPTALVNEISERKLDEFEASVKILEGIEDIARAIASKEKEENRQREAEAEVRAVESRERRETEARVNRRESPSSERRATLSLDDLLGNSVESTRNEPQEIVFSDVAPATNNEGNGAVRSIEELFGEGGLPF